MIKIDFVFWKIIMERQLTSVSLFSGCGGFDYGAHQAGVNIIWANDFDTHAVAAYRTVLPTVPVMEGDIRDISSFPQADILIGCYPCTGFSLAARRKWKAGTTRDLHKNEDNFLYREFMRVLRLVTPRFLFVENVGGMQTADDGWFFEKQLSGFKRHGYRVKYQILKAEDYGVAQTRRRMFIVGVHRDVKNFEYNFPAPKHGGPDRPPFRVLRDVIGDLELWPVGEYYDEVFHGHYLTRNRKRAWDEASYTIVANAHHVPLHPQGSPMRFVTKDTWVLQGDANRRLSWRECARIQGLPDTVLPSGSLIDKYRVVGNAVPPALGHAIVSPVVCTYA